MHAAVDGEGFCFAGLFPGHLFVMGLRAAMHVKLVCGMGE